MAPSDAADEPRWPAASDGATSSLLYVVLYSVLALGSFATVAMVAARGDGNSTSLDTFRGIAKSNPVFALGFTVLLLAQAGVPLTSGFVAKFGVIRAAVSTESYALALLAMVSAVVAAYLYLRIMVSMWLAEPASSSQPVRIGTAGRVSLALAVATTLILGVFPSILLDLKDLGTNFVR